MITTSRTATSADVRGGADAMKTLLIWIVRAYRLVLSPMLGQNCRFYPSCSSYAIEALQIHGALRGSWLPSLLHW